MREVIPFGEEPEEECLRIAACLEEHFPHSMAKAVVDAAKKRRLAHEEMHSKVEYIVAHGISSYIDGKKVVIGSSHFVFEDEGCKVRPEYRERFEALPEEKAGFVEREKALGHKVIMIGDGINDSPALSAADAGIAISDGAELAREIADITIAAADLGELVVLKRLANGMLKRIGKNYQQIIGINAGLIVFGIAGVLQPTTSALLHNTSTLLISLRSMRNLLTDRTE